jgi:hypothetical protein
MKFEPGDLIEEVVNGQADARCIVLKHETHPVVSGLSEYTLYLMWAGGNAGGRRLRPGETLILSNTVLESPHDDYYWRKNEA